MSEEEDAYEERAALVGSRVRVTLADGNEVRGLLVGADPETRHVAVARAVDGDGGGESGRVRLMILLDHHIRAISRVHDAPADDALKASLDGLSGSEDARVESEQCIEDESTVIERAARLKAFLQRHFISYESVRGPAGTTEIRLFGGAATLLPPFKDPDTCVESENEQLVGRLRPLLARFMDEEEVS